MHPGWLEDKLCVASHQDPSGVSSERHEFLALRLVRSPLLLTLPGRWERCDAPRERARKWDRRFERDRNLDG